MSRRLRTAAFAVVFGAALLPLAPTGATTDATCEPSWSTPAYDRPPTHPGVVTLRDELIEMRDGVVIATDVHLPADAGGQPATDLPTVVTITGYNKGGVIASPNTHFLQRGYAHVIVDDRGTGNSGGQWDAWGDEAKRDYVEVLQWIAHQPWSSGEIVMHGASYMGLTQIFTAAQLAREWREGSDLLDPTDPPHLKALFSMVPSGDAYRDITFQGGQGNVAFIPAWMGLMAATGATPPSYAASDPSLAAQTTVEHATNAVTFKGSTTVEGFAGGDVSLDGDFWRERSPLEFVDDVDIPTFLVGGLNDIFQRSTPMLYERLRAQGTDTRLLVGPWGHAGTGAGLLDHGLPSTDQLALQWFDHHVFADAAPGADVSCIPAVTQWYWGENAYRTSPGWPHPDLAPHRWHLRADGSLSDAAPEADEGGRLLPRHPFSGACSRSTNQWLLGLLDGTRCDEDNRLAEVDQLVYTTAPFERDVVVNGPIQADLWVSTPTPDTALSVAVSSVAPDGTSKGLTNGLLTATFRDETEEPPTGWRSIAPWKDDTALPRVIDGMSLQPWHPHDRQVPVPTDTPVKLAIEVFQTSALIPAGSSLRIAIGASDFPHAGPPVRDAPLLTGGVVTVHHGPDTPSRVTIPLIAMAE